MSHQQRQPVLLSPVRHGLIFLFACAVIASRRPDAIFHAQFYAEDGHVWFADAYNLGWWPALFRTWTGYFLTLPRLGASLALLVPLSRVPLLLNLLAISIHALPVNLLLASRSSEWGSFRFRGLLAGMYLALPNSTEVSFGITDANFLLALSTVILILACPPQTNREKALDVLVIVLCGVSGPFCIFLLPVSLFLAWKRGHAWHRVQAAILASCCAVQSWALLFLAPAARAHRVLGASPGLLARILGSQVYLGALLGSNGLSTLSSRWLSLTLVCVAIVGTTFVCICFLKAPMPLKIFLVFAVALFASSLISPVEWGRPDVPVWAVLAGSPGHRYWFFPTLSFAWSLLFCLQSKPPILKVLAGYLVLIMCFGIVRDWRHRAFQETQFSASVQRFEAAPAGSIVTIQEYPQGWDMKLIKRSSKR
ncbi:MAG TPA: hypothetical protein VGG85_07445 [Terracidiphilus sp.]